MIYPDWTDLTPTEQLAELRLETASVYWPDFQDDPCTVVECDNCGAGMVIQPDETRCDECSWDFEWHVTQWAPDCVSDLEAA